MLKQNIFPDKILLIDDEEDFLTTTEFILRSADYQVQIAKNGQQGLVKARFFTPDLILLDINMPNLDGLTVCKMLKAGNKTKSIPIVMLTAQAQKRDVEKAIIAGANDYIIKPFDEDYLLDKISKTLRARH